MGTFEAGWAVAFTRWTGKNSGVSNTLSSNGRPQQAPPVAQDSPIPVAKLRGRNGRTDLEDVDATPTRQSVLTANTGANVPSPERKSHSRARTIGLSISPEKQPALPSAPGRFAEGLVSPRPIGPRPLPSRRSVSMQSVPTTSPPLSPLGPENPHGIDQGLLSPVSPGGRGAMDLPSKHPLTHAGLEMMQSRLWPRRHSVESSGKNDFDGDTTQTTSFMPVSASFPHISSFSSPSPHVSQAMLAARADPASPHDASIAQRLPTIITTTQPPPPTTTTTAQQPSSISSPPSSFFVSNLDGPSPSPIFFDQRRSGDSARGWSSISDNDRRDSVAGDSPLINPPARFEAFGGSSWNPRSFSIFFFFKVVLASGNKALPLISSHSRIPLRLCF